jgi:hypothetical protein
MDMGSSRKFLGLIISAFCAIVFFLPPIFAQDVSTRPADLVNNEKVIYTLPDVGSISPDNPLFFLKQIRDGVVLALPQDPLDRIRTLIQFGDKYTVYAEKLAHLSKTQRSVETFQTAMNYQSTMIDLLKEESRKPNRKEDQTYGELRNIAHQSNIKQAEMIRLLIDDVSISEQPAFVQLLEKNMQLRKKLQGI